MFFWLIPWAALLFGGFAFGTADPTKTRRMPTWTRLASSFVLVIAAWLWFRLYREPYSLLIAIGMTLGLVGDLFMARLLPVKQPILGGMAAFGLGHVAYIAAFLHLSNIAASNAAAFLGNTAGFDAPLSRYGAWLVWLLIGAVGWYVVVFRGQKPTILHYAALPYSLLLASTAAFATALALQQPVFIPLAIGAALFLLSDLILAAQLFNHAHFPLIGDVIWLTYGPAQALIVYSAATATPFL
jgi:uncharacterized membrane protein YhhN